LRISFKLFYFFKEYTTYWLSLRNILLLILMILLIPIRTWFVLGLHIL
jgi:hypothetical protein